MTALDPAAHYQEQAIVAAAIDWHRARTSAGVDAACDRLHAVVGVYLAPAEALADAMVGRGAR